MAQIAHYLNCASIVNFAINLPHLINMGGEDNYLNTLEEAIQAIRDGDISEVSFPSASESLDISNTNGRAIEANGESYRIKSNEGPLAIDDARSRSSDGGANAHRTVEYDLNTLSEPIHSMRDGEIYSERTAYDGITRDSDNTRSVSRTGNENRSGEARRTENRDAGEPSAGSHFTYVPSAAEPSREREVRRNRPTYDSLEERSYLIPTSNVRRSRDEVRVYIPANVNIYDK